jgi:phosphatidylethanolamine/phosphatidyl-N-methylethanolamine N-methyltransferase
MLQNPREVGALFPSSPVLSELIASQVDPKSPAILEVGAGTGPVTRALLDRGVDPERLFVIERDPTLVDYLRQQFPNVHVRCADAAHADQVLTDASVGKAGTVISGIPLRNLSPADRVGMVQAMMKAVAPGGQLIQFTYAIGCPIPSRRLNLYAECVGRVWANLPPAAVWRFTARNQ